MKRLLFTALLWTVALHAQGRMGAVHSSSSGPARSSAPHFSGSAGGFRSGPAVRPMPVTRPMTSQRFARPAGSSFASRSFTGTPSRHRVFVSGNFNRFHHGRHFHPVRPFFFGGLNAGCFNSFDPFFCNSGFFNPYYSYPIFPSDYYEPPPQPVAVPYDNGQSQALSLEVERLSDEIDRMRDENRRQEDQRAEAQSETSSRPPGLTEPPHVLVLKDGRQILADNYAISSNMIWVLDNGRVKKIPLSDVDVTATQKANADTDLHLRH
ncbi:MAG: SlyX family protein [Acidobacteriia bacterium]|nr:SlyX family protein [Terriglobia bacterium]